MSALHSGDRIADRYVIDRVLARGGMGVVYRATDERLGRTVAVKVLLPELGRDEVSIARFEREAGAAARLSHPGVVSVSDFGTTPSGLSYLVMEFVVGTTLADELERGRLLPLRAADVVEQALGALTAAHAAGIFHRDLKPGNLMLVPVGEGGRELVKVLDFGIAQLKAGAAYTRLTSAGAVVGTPSYMAPEQARGEPCDERTDVYAMGVVLWCCLTGALPFRNRDLAALMRAVQDEIPRRADELFSDVPAELASIAARALAKRPEDRFPSASAFAAALVAQRSGKRAAGGDEVTLVPSTQPVSPPSMPIPSTARQSLSPVVPVVVSAPAPAPLGQASPAPLAAASTPAAVRPARTKVLTAGSAPSPPAPVATPPPSAVTPAPPPKKKRRWLRWLVLLFVLALPIVALVGGVVFLGVWIFEPRWIPTIQLPFPLPTPSLPSVQAPSYDPLTPAQPLLPTTDVCAQTITCCEAYSSRVETMDAVCADVVGFPRGDVASCQRQRDRWRQLAIDHGTSLPECQ